MGRREEAERFWSTLQAAQAAEAARVQVAEQAELARQQGEMARLQVEQNKANATAYAAQEEARGRVEAAKVRAGR
jgi:hypothetical protein